MFKLSRVQVLSALGAAAMAISFIVLIYGRFMVDVKHIIYALFLYCLIYITFRIAIDYSKKVELNNNLKRLFIYFGSFLTAVWAGACFIIQDFNKSLCVFVLIFMVLFYLLMVKLILSGVYWVNQQVCVQKVTKVGNKQVYWFVCISIIGYAVISAIYFLAYNPGIMMTDSVSQWQQAHALLFSNWHPVIDTLLIKLTTMIYDSPISYVILQTVIFIVSILWITIWFIKQNKRNLIWAYLIVVSTWIFPLFSLMNVFVVKDTLYTIMLLDLSFIVYRIYVSDGLYLYSWKNSLLIVIVTFFFISLRSNGIEAYFFAFIFFLILFRKRIFWLWHLLSLGVIVLYFLISGPIYNHYNVIPADSSEAFGVPTQILGGIYNGNGKISYTEKKVLYRIMPADQWQNNYNPYWVDGYKYSAGSEYNRPYIRKNLMGLTLFTMNLALKNPVQAGKAYLKTTTYLWRSNDQYVMTLPDRTFKTMGPMRLTSNKSDKSALKFQAWDYSAYQSQNRRALKLTNSLKRVFMLKGIRVLIYPATISIILVMIIIVYLNSVAWRTVSVLLPFIGSQLTLLIGLPSQQFRYFYGIYLVFMLILLIVNSNLSNINTIKNEIKE